MTYTTAPKVDDRHNVTLLVTKVNYSWQTMTELFPHVANKLARR